MKYGLTIEQNKEPGWEQHYMNYQMLKNMIKKLETKNLMEQPGQPDIRQVSLTVPAPTNRAGLPVLIHEDATQERFFQFLEDEMARVESFIKQKTIELRARLEELQKAVQQKQISHSGQAVDFSEERQMVDVIGTEFLKLEKFTNVNLTAFHKILKKHDKHLPNKCKQFYMNRMHERAWNRGDASDLFVIMSSIYSRIRGDQAPEEVKSAKQEFNRKTTKYWVPTNKVSQVKYMILQHLPVFLQKPKIPTNQTAHDFQLINSVYLDNAMMELYHGRLDKTPGAIALRFRWYGNGDPETVFVERKTHREAWTGDESVKERFIIPESEVIPLLRGNYNKEAEKQKMIGRGEKQSSIEDWDVLATDVIQAINSKQLYPVVRTQYMRTAFQIPFDPSVRISLDTNLCMLLEGVKGQERWYRDPSNLVPPNEITRFPHAILEIKLQLPEGVSTPEWVTDLEKSGLIQEVHKFSKFIHGCATLLHDDVQAVPYWFDDPSIKESLVSSGAESLLLEEAEGANKLYSHLLPNVRKGRQGYQSINGDLEHGDVRTHIWHEEQYDQLEWFDKLCLCWAGSPEMNTVTQKVEPKLIFANERTFIHWLHMSVTLSSIGTAILAFSSENGMSQYYGLMLLPVSLFFCGYAVWVYVWRGKKIRERQATRWDDPLGPAMLAVVLTLALSITFVMKLMACIHPEAYSEDLL